jgi:aquaporin Z
MRTSNPTGSRSALQALRDHWPEYLIEAWALGTFMICAGLVATALEYPASRLHAWLALPAMRRVVAGLAMGLTAIALIYSPWGKRSGAHMNPSVTVAFWTLGRVSTWDAVFYISAQFIGGTLGVWLVAALLGAPFTDAPVRYASTLPGPAGELPAFIAELAMSGFLMLTLLQASASKRFAPYTGIIAGGLVASYIGLESPLSGMSMNPARSFASAAPGMLWHALWIYFIAPVVGMLAGAQLYRLARRPQGCAKLLHPPEVRCIHCGYEPRATGAISAVSLRSAES